jgi:arylsulfatase A-like enzyme
VILTDDQPALDGRLFDYMPATSALRDAGVRFADFHSSSPLCCPARASYLTGRWTHHHGQVNNGGIKFDNSVTLATALDGIGYHTFLVGKFMNGYGGCHGPNCAPHIPPGWDRWAAFAKSDYYDYDLYVGDAGADASPVHYGIDAADYSTDVIAARATELIRSAPAAEPIFAWVVPFGIHTPTAPAPRYATADCSPLRWEPPNWHEEDVSDKPAYVQTQLLGVGTQGANLQRECRSLLAVDDLVAAVRDALVDTGRLDNTILVYGGDNGMLLGEHRLPGKAAPYQTTVPFFISWPALAVGVVSERAQDVDFAPTICDLVGCTMGPYADGAVSPDGVSFAALLLGGAAPARDAVLEEMVVPHGLVPAWSAVTTTPASPLGLWHYIEYDTGERELYDRQADPWELENRVGDPALAGVQDELAARLAALRG